MSKLWNKGDGSHKLHPLVEKYTVGSDYLLDLELLPYDIEASKAHVKGLVKIGILTEEDAHKILASYEKLEQMEVEIKPEDEDCHTVIENFLVEELGELGKKVHAGRSRNDQVLVALRLWMKAQAEDLKLHIRASYAKLWQMTESYAKVAMPGYTHTQQAMLTSVGHYLASFAEALEDDEKFLDLVSGHIDQSPLGSAAGFGVSFDLDREGVAAELGFKKVQKNSLYCQNSRGKFESLYLEALVQIMMTLGKIANDFLLWTSREFEFFQVGGGLTTGSSIMPQKKNLDLLEILRGNVAVVMANQMMVKEISKNLLSGYNRDLQLLKKPLFESAKIVSESLEIILLFLENVEVNEAALQSKIKQDIFAADLANEIVKKEGVAFREAYGMAMDRLEGQEFDLGENLAGKISLGGPGNFLK